MGRFSIFFCRFPRPGIMVPWGSDQNLGRWNGSSWLHRRWDAETAAWFVVSTALPATSPTGAEEISMATRRVASKMGFFEPKFVVNDVKEFQDPHFRAICWGQIPLGLIYPVGTSNLLVLVGAWNGHWSKDHQNYSIHQQYMAYNWGLMWMGKIWG